MATTNKSQRKKILKHIGNVGMAMLSFNLLTSPVSTVAPDEILGSEAGRKATKEAIDGALKMTKSHYSSELIVNSSRYCKGKIIRFKGNHA